MMQAIISWFSYYIITFSVGYFACFGFQFWMDRREKKEQQVQRDEEMKDHQKKLESLQFECACLKADVESYQTANKPARDALLKVEILHFQEQAKTAALQIKITEIQQQAKDQREELESTIQAWEKYAIEQKAILQNARERARRLAKKPQPSYK